MKIETANKRFRRDHRYILVDNMYIAKSIVDYCMENFMRERWNTVEAYKSTINAKVEVIFLCTKDVWDRVMDYYDLVRSQEYSSGKNRKGLICYSYELNSNKGI